MEVYSLTSIHLKIAKISSKYIVPRTTLNKPKYISLQSNPSRNSMFFKIQTQENNNREMNSESPENRKRWAGAAFFVGVRDAGVAVEAVVESPAPIGFSLDRHFGPPVYPDVMLTYLAVGEKAGDDGVGRLVAAPHGVVGVGGDAAVGVEVPPHWWRAGALPVRVQLSPVRRRRL